MTIDDLVNDITKQKYLQPKLDIVKPKQKHWYKEYLESDHWKEVRINMFSLHNNKCQHCNSKIFLQVHHKIDIVDNMQLATDFDNLEALCKSCHSKLTYATNKYLWKPVKFVDNQLKWKHLLH